MQLSRDKVLKVGLRVCELWGDSDADKKAMKADIDATPDNDLPELYEHFITTYKECKGMPKGCLRERIFINA